MKKIIFIILLLPVISCSSNKNNANTNLSVRAVLESDESSSADISVYIEGNDGDEVSGAIVLVSDSSNDVLNLKFDPSKYCYTGSMPILSDGMFSFKVSSTLSPNPIKFNVQHSLLTTKPVVLTFQDSSGNSVLSGQTLSSNKEIQVGWDSIGSGMVYQVTVKTALKTIYAESTEGCTFTIPASMISAGTNYMLEVEAQKIYGDPYFEKSNYYSVSIQRSSSMSFNVQ